MNIEIANRLQKLRKDKGLSQEELASRLGVSRQAVSKWERADASPDTDNLICLAKIYGISLDELLNSDETVEDIAREKRAERKGKDCVRIDGTGIHIKDEDGATVDINLSGIHISDATSKICSKGKKTLLEEIFGGIIIFSICLTYIILGTVKNLWHPTWLIFFLIPILFSFIEAIKKKKFSEFAFPVVVSGIYLFLGFEYTLWHPYWFLFLTIIPYYILMHGFDHLINPHPHNHDIHITKTDDEDD